MSRSALVLVQQGALLGRRRRTPSGSSFFSYQGVPYAKPPLGALRFKAPLPPDSWLDVRDAIEPGNKSLQYDGLTKLIVGNEDCLYLNVFTPRHPADRDGEPLAVLVWIHGGGFLFGSSYMYQPEPFMDNGVVLVTVNYRVGPLGFLGLNTVEAPGNSGLKDQNMALRWVQENIAAFGGDPENVTIWGQSAGGASVHFHMMSPLSRGLFQRAIIQSGSALLSRNVARDPSERAKSLAIAAGCDPATSRDPAALLLWLQAAPAEKLVWAVEATKTEEEKRRRVLFVFVPCVEPKHEGAFLDDHPESLVARGNVVRVPLILGVVSHEGILNLPGSEDRARLFPRAEGADLSEAAFEAMTVKVLVEIDSDLKLLLPTDLLDRARDPERVQQMCKRLREFYFQGKKVSEDALETLANVYTDANYVWGVLGTAREHSRLGTPVYLYEFAFCGLSNTMTPIMRSKVKGACHNDEIGYLFTLPGLPEPQEGSPEAAVKCRLGRMWTDFAKGGNPTPSRDGVITAKWVPFSEETPNYLRISENLEEKTDLLKDRMQFWTDLYTM